MKLTNGSSVESARTCYRVLDSVQPSAASNRTQYEAGRNRTRPYQTKGLGASKEGIQTAIRDLSDAESSVRMRE